MIANFIYITLGSRTSFLNFTINVNRQNFRKKKMMRSTKWNKGYIKRAQVKKNTSYYKAPDINYMAWSKIPSC